MMRSSAFDPYAAPVTRHAVAAPAQGQAQETWQQRLPQPSVDVVDLI